jgi:CheY-like chemotaxis protein
MLTDQSEFAGRAATFSVHPARGTAGVRRTRAGPGVLRVLVVDDNRDAADSLAMLATLWGYDARRAYDGAAALRSALTNPPDVVLMDIGMPRMDGFRLARLLRRPARLVDALLVAVTGYADEAHRRLGAAAFDHYLVKPIEPTTVERLLLRERFRRAAWASRAGDGGLGPGLTPWCRTIRCGLAKPVPARTGPSYVWLASDTATGREPPLACGRATGA